MEQQEDSKGNSSNGWLQHHMKNKAISNQCFWQSERKYGVLHCTHVKHSLH